MSKAVDGAKWYEQGLKWKRRRKNGVSEWRGTWRNGPPLSFCRFFLVLTTVFFLTAVTTTVLSLLKVMAFLPGSLTFFFVCLVYGVVTWFAYQQHRIFSHLQEPDDLAAQMGMTPEELERLAEEKDIKPKVYFNDVPLYNPEDLIQAKILLRPSAEPVASATLLRAAAPTASPTEQEQLLRATES